MRRSLRLTFLLGGVAVTTLACGPSLTPAEIEAAWRTTAGSIGGKPGETKSFSCPAGGTAQTVWGHVIYTDDSSICSAAVHAGVITLERGGDVTYQVQPGRQLYGSSSRNGITSTAYGAWGQSFSFPSDKAGAAPAEGGPVLVTWETTAAMLTDPSKTYVFECAAGGKPNSVWGTDTYTADSSICTAGVHAGKITVDKGGAVTLEMRPGEPTYTGSARNGVQTTDYGAFGRSFVLK
jgi:LCCL domain